MSKVELKEYIKNSVKVAIDFEYGDDVVKAIKSAKSESEVTRILINARHNKRW